MVLKVCECKITANHQVMIISFLFFWWKCMGDARNVGIVQENAMIIFAHAAYLIKRFPLYYNSNDFKKKFVGKDPNKKSKYHWYSQELICSLDLIKASSTASPFKKHFRDIKTGKTVKGVVYRLNRVNGKD